MFPPVLKTGATVYFVGLYILISSGKILTNWAWGVNVDNEGVYGLIQMTRDISMLM